MTQCKPEKIKLLSNNHQEICREVRKRLKEAKQVVAFTGAGISQESGIPTFRGSDGLWENYRIEEVATPEAFESNPTLVWDFYRARRKTAILAKPNPAHLAIASWEARFDFSGVVTQNIDGLHAKSGSKNIQELHGSLWKNRCTNCDFLTDDFSLEAAELPKCCQCGALLRPHIVWFGEALDLMVIQKSLAWMREADMIFIIGTSGVVEPAASFVREAKLYGACLVEVNTEETALTHAADFSIFAPCGQVFKEWINE